MAHELPFIAAIDEAIRLEMERDDTVLYFGQNMATTENEPSGLIPARSSVDDKVAKTSEQVSGGNASFRNPAVHFASSFGPC